MENYKDLYDKENKKIQLSTSSDVVDYFGYRLSEYLLSREAPIDGKRYLQQYGEWVDADSVSTQYVNDLSMLESISIDDINMCNDGTIILSEEQFDSLDLTEVKNKKIVVL